MSLTNPSDWWKDYGPAAMAATAAGIVFLIDLVTPPEIPTGVLYVFVIVLALLAPPHAVAPVAIAATGMSGLALAVVLLSPEGARDGLEVWARVLTVASIWVTAALVSRQRRTQGELERRTEEAQTYHERSDRSAAELRQTARALERSVRELEDIKAALDQSTIVAITDSAGDITYANDKFCEISEYAREELLGRNHRIVKSEYHPPEFFRDIWETISGGRLWHGEIKNRAKSGRHYWVDTTIVPFLDERGRPYQYVAIRHDITERKRLEAQRQEQAALTRLGEMAAVVAHELKNPLAGLRGALDIIRHRLSGESPEARIMAEMVARIDSLNLMVQDLLVFARPTLPTFAPVRMRAIVSETVTLVTEDPDMRDLVIDVAGTDPLVHADAGMIKAALLNLLINAAQAMGRHGHVAVSMADTDGCCEVRVVDRGPGIPEATREKVFEPFFTTKHRGTGLGLPVARRTVELHGGRLQFTCPPEGGTVMRFTLPLSSANA